MNRETRVSIGRACAIVAVLMLLGVGRGHATEQDVPSQPTAAPMPPKPARVVCWIADGYGMHPTGDLEGFLVDRLSASGDRVAVDPSTACAVLRILGLSGQSVFDPASARRLAAAVQADWVLWIKTVARDVRSEKGLSFPYLFNRRRLDAHVFYDMRLYDAGTGTVIGSKRLALSDRGDATWQIGEDERLDPVYNNDPVEIHHRLRALDWRAAAAISRYVAGLLSSGTVAATDSP